MSGCALRAPGDPILRPVPVPVRVAVRHPRLNRCRSLLQNDRDAV
jgi:hypothetical protein